MGKYEFRVGWDEEDEAMRRAFQAALGQDDLSPKQWFKEQVRRYLNPKAAPTDDDLDVPGFLKRVKAARHKPPKTETASVPKAETPKVQESQVTEFPANDDNPEQIDWGKPEPTRRIGEFRGGFPKGGK